MSRVKRLGDGPRWTVDLPDTAEAMAWAPNGESLAVATLAGAVLVIDAESGKRVSVAGEHRGGALAVAFSPDGAALATAGQDGKVRLVRQAAGAAPVELALGRGWVEELSWSGDGALLAATLGKEVHVISAGGEVIERIPWEATVVSIAWIPGAQLLALAGYGGVCMRGVGSREPKMELGWKRAILALAPSPDGRVLAAGSQEGSVRLWKLPSLEELEITGYDSKVRALAWDAAGLLLAIAGGDALTLWSFAKGGTAGEKPIVLAGHRARISGLGFAGDRRIGAVAEDGRFVLWERRGACWGAVEQFECEAPLLGLAVAPARNRAAVCGADARLMLFELGSDAPAG
jgi:WD40 repeat protein